MSSPKVWTYTNWSGPVVSLGGDEWFRRTIVPLMCVGCEGSQRWLKEQ